MTGDRVVAVLVTARCPVRPTLAAAMLEDVANLVADTPQVSAALAVEPGAQARADEVAWPGTPRVAVPSGTGLATVLAALAPLANQAVAVVVADAPDLPSLLIGKLFSALAGPPAVELAVCPAEGGGLVAAASASSGPPAWLSEGGVGLDDADGLDRLRAAAPHRTLVVAPGWHRIRGEADLARLDRGLDGWDATRALVGESA